MGTRLTVMIFLMATAMPAALTCVTHAATADPGYSTYPARPIRVVVPISAGSASDLLARMIGPKLFDAWGQVVVVDNRTGAGGTLGVGIVAKAPADGHTILLTASSLAASASLYRNLPYDVVRDFAAVTQVASGPLVLVVAPGLGVKSVRQLVTRAQQQPGKLNYGSAGIGSGTHFAGELFRHAAGINVAHIPYKGVPEAIADTLSGRIQYYLPPVLSSLPLIRDGKLIALGVTTKDRATTLPDVPTIAEAGLAGFVYDSWFGIVAPARTPRSVINKLGGEVTRILAAPDVRGRMAAVGVLPRSSSPEEFGKLIRDEIETRSRVFKDAGTKVE